MSELALGEQNGVSERNFRLHSRHWERHVGGTEAKAHSDATELRESLFEADQGGPYEPCWELISARSA